MASILKNGLLERLNDTEAASPVIVTVVRRPPGEDVSGIVYVEGDVMLKPSG